MEDLFDPVVSGKLVDRISRLSQDSPPLWGKMGVSQMLAHCQVPLQVALNDVRLKRNIFGLLFGKMAKKKILSGEPFGKNLPTDPNFKIKDQRNFEEEKQKLITLVNRFTSAGPSGVGKEPHPFFGKLTSQENSYLSWKHLDHHLKQFGV